jgi:hypothetical protein
MTNCEEGKIYKLVDVTTDQIIYVGSTVSTLKLRMDKHRSAAKKNKLKIYKHINENVGIDNVDIQLICDYPCETRKQLALEEGRQTAIIGFDTLYNTCFPGRTHKETIKVYYQEHKDQIKEYAKEYIIANKDDLNDRACTKFTCVCGGRYTYANKTQHLNTVKHNIFMN